MTSPERIYALIESVSYIVKNKIPGDILECGVWKGGSMMAVAETLLRLGNKEKHLYLFDTFEGMTKPGQEDAFLKQSKFPDEDWVTAEEKFEATKIDEHSSDWLQASMEGVQTRMEETGYDKEKIHLVKGPVEETIPAQAPEVLSLLRLDTDWYESTRHELVHLFPRLSSKGVLIIDDYGHWLGVKKATDEYIAERKLNILLNRIDYTGRIAVKP